MRSAADHAILWWRCDVVIPLCAVHSPGDGSHTVQIVYFLYESLAHAHMRTARLHGIGRIRDCTYSPRALQPISYSRVLRTCVCARRSKKEVEFCFVFGVPAGRGGALSPGGHAPAPLPRHIHYYVLMLNIRWPIALKIITRPQGSSSSAN